MNSYDGPIGSETREEWKRRTYLQHYGTKMSLDTLKTPRYTLDQLWPYHGFVKPIHELATPHLQNISDMFADGERYVLRSNGSPRSKEEEMELRRRVGVVKDVLRTRIANETTEKHTNMSRRIKDTKILLATLRDRRNQMYNAPDTQEYQAALAHCLSLLIDIQMELDL